VVVVVVDRALCVVALEGDALEAVGWGRDRVLGGGLDEVLSGRDLRAWREPLRRALEGEESDFDWRSTGGEPRLTGRIAPLRAGDGSIQWALATCVVAGDEADTLEEELDRIGALYRAVTASLPETAVMAFDEELRFQVAYGEALDLNGWSSEQVQGRTPRELLPAAHADLVEPLLRAAVRGERSCAELPSVHGDRTMLTYTAPVPDVPTVAGVAISIDITERKQAEEASRRLAAIVDQSDDAILAVDRNGVISAWNRGAERLFGRPAGEALGHPMTEVVPRHRLGAEAQIMRRVLDGETIGYETQRVRADHTLLEVSVIASPIRDANGEVVAASAIARDITERKMLEYRLEHLANRDPLTGLLNRRAFQEELDRTVRFVRRYRLQAALVVIDVDHFKYINDTYGHAAGDAVLRRVSDLLRHRLRDTDVIGRLGGDEFALILPGTPPEQAQTVAAELLETLREDMDIGHDGQLVRLTASFGIAPVEATTLFTPDQLLVHADIAMYEAKEAGRNRLAVTDFTAREPAFMSRLGWAERIRRALEQDDFVLYHQPIVNLHNNAVERAELLIRMRGDRDELVTPASFLPVAERFGQVQAIDRWVVDRALELLRELDEPPILHVNLSGVTMTDPELIDALPARIAREATDPSRLAFEITETAAIENVEEAQRLADHLSALGCQIVLDDFGSGFGSFYYLKHLPFDSLKIDGEFVSQITTGKADRVTVEAIVAMARGLETTTIAECVEDEATLALLRDLGVDYVQGFHLGRPGPQPVST
jgi:diguanylate cyclase (GGDEF)-like protein/PAS domain S-box-containing protein